MQSLFFPVLVKEEKQRVAKVKRSKNNTENMTAALWRLIKSKYGKQILVNMDVKLGVGGSGRHQ